MGEFQRFAVLGDPVIKTGPLQRPLELAVDRKLGPPQGDNHFVG
jgi:hypothetical protein